MKRAAFILAVFCFFAATYCGKRDEKIEISRMQENTQRSQGRVLSNGNGKLTPELFFRISIEVNRISRKYAPSENEGGTAPTNDSGAEKEIRAVYLKHGITEEVFNSYSESHFRELENFLSRHPEIEGQLHP